jgi:hypothetical protein
LRDIVDLDVGQPSGAIDADKLGVGVDLATRQARPTGNAQGRDTPSIAIGDTGKDLEGDILQRVGDFDEFESHSQIGLV